MTDCASLSVEININGIQTTHSIALEYIVVF
jgi:hypothetical protein